jgi:hypothetical protein
MYTVSTHPCQGYTYPNGDYSRPKPVWNYTRNVGGTYLIVEEHLKRLQNAILKKISGECMLTFAKHVKKQIELQDPKFAPVTGIFLFKPCLTKQDRQSFTGKMYANLNFIAIATLALCRT